MPASLPSDDSIPSDLPGFLAPFATQDACAELLRRWRYPKPLVICATIVRLIAATTTTTTGPRIYSELNRNNYPKGLVVSEEQMKELGLEPNPFHSESSYAVQPWRSRAYPKVLVH